MTKALAPHERWWEDHAELDGLFRTWLEQSDAWSREEIADYARATHAEDVFALRVLEVGPGLYHDWRAHWRDAAWVSYSAVELTPKLVAYGQHLGVPVRRGSITALPYDDESVDIAYCRHVLEHLAPLDIPRALRELVRVSTRGAAVAFFKTKEKGYHDYVEDNLAAPGTYCHTLSRAAISHWAETCGLIPQWSTGGRDWVLWLTWPNDSNC